MATRRILRVALPMILCSVAGCDGDDGDDGGYVAPSDACALVTDDEVFEVLEKAEDPVPGEHDDSAAQCGWGPQGITAEILVTVWANAVDAEGWADEFVDTLRAGLEEDLVTELDDLGDEAFVTGDADAISWSVVWRASNDYVVVLGVAPVAGVPGSPVSSQMEAIDLARSIEGRIP